MITLLSLSVSLAIYLPTALGDPIAEFNAIKAKNARALTGCIDFRGQSRAQRAYAHEMQESLKVFLRSRIGESDRQRLIRGHIMGVATDVDHVVVIFYKWVDSIRRSPDAAWRFDHRQRLEELIVEWQSLKGNHDAILVRFDDECDVPIADWK